MLASLFLVLLLLNFSAVAAIRRRLTVMELAAEVLAFTFFASVCAAVIFTLVFLSSFFAWTAASLIMFLTAILHVASLNFFQVTGFCLDLSGLRMVLVNARLGVLHEASYDPVRAVGSVALMIILTAMIGWYLWFLISDAEPSAMSALWSGGVAIAAASLFWSLSQISFLDACRQGGPFSTLLADFIAGRRFQDLQARLGEVPALTPTRSATLQGNKDLVVLVIIDSFRSSLFGDDVVSQRWMPRLFEASTLGSLFNNHRCNAVMSEYSDISLLAGDLRWRSYYHGMPGPAPGNRTLHQLFKQAGYSTAHVSAQDERWCRMHLWYRNGIDHLLHAGGGNLRPRPQQDGQRTRVLAGAKLSDEVVVEAALDLLRDRTQPLFMTINLQSTHVPFFYDQAFDLPWPHISSKSKVRFGGLDESMIEFAQMKYANALRHVDNLLSRVIEAVSSQLTDQSATIWITGDTGQAFGEHGYSGHGAGLHDELLHTPLIILGENRFEPRVNTDTDHLQVYSWLANYAGLEGAVRPSASPEAGRAIPLVCQTPMANQLGVILGNSKFIMDCRNLKVTKFDLSLDPAENNTIVLPEAEAEGVRRQILLEVSGRLANAASVSGDSAISLVAAQKPLVTRR